MRGIKAKRLRKLAYSMATDIGAYPQHTSSGWRYPINSPRRFYKHLKRQLRNKPLAPLYTKDAE